MPVANARMYSVTPQVKAAWKQLLDWVLRDAGLHWEVIDYDAPQPLAALWSRDDLGLVMMCGLPYTQREPQPLLIAAPVPAPARYGGRAVYCTDIVVRADAPFRSLADTFGGVAGFTLADSMSGGVAFQNLLERHRSPARGPLYRRWVNNLVHARGVIDALVRGDIDVGPLDSYSHDLLVRNDPSFAGAVRTIASTPFTPIPPLVATAPLSPEIVERLRASLARSVRTPELVPVTDRLLLSGFAVPERQQYLPLRDMAQRLTTPLEKL